MRRVEFLHFLGSIIHPGADMNWFVWNLKHDDGGIVIMGVDSLRHNKNTTMIPSQYPGPLSLTCLSV